MSVSKRDLSVPAGNRKVMIYVAPDVHRAMEQIAFDERRSTSSAYVAAARAFLEARGKQIEADPVPVTADRAPVTAVLAEAIDRQGTRIEELHAAIADLLGAVPRGGTGPAGTKAAEAMKAMLRILRTAGAAGMTGRELDAAAYAIGVRSGTGEVAKAVLRGAGLVRCAGKRWYVDGT